MLPQYVRMPAVTSHVRNHGRRCENKSWKGPKTCRGSQCFHGLPFLNAGGEVNNLCVLYTEWWWWQFVSNISSSAVRSSRCQGGQIRAGASWWCLSARFSTSAHLVCAVSVNVQIRATKQVISRPTFQLVHVCVFEQKVVPNLRYEREIWPGCVFVIET